MIYGETVTAVEQARTRFTKKWQLRCPAVVESLEEAGDELFTFLRFPSSQWKALRTTNALERINEEFRRRTKTQASLAQARTPCCCCCLVCCAAGQVKLQSARWLSRYGAGEEGGVGHITMPADDALNFSTT